MRTTVALAALVVLGSYAVSTAFAQEEPEGPRPNIVAFSEWKCPFSNLEEAVDLVNTSTRPIYQELIDEGMIVGWNLLTHFYGDEWNLIFVTLAEDIQSAIEANTEFFRRAEERGLEAEGDRFVELCPHHRDNIYSIAHADGEEGM